MPHRVRAGRTAVLVLAVFLWTGAAGCRTVPVDDPRVERAEAFERVGSWPEAAALWTEIYIASGSRNTEAGLAAARASIVAGRADEARVRLVDLAARRPDDPRVPELQGQAHEQLGLLDAARDDYRAALELDPDRPRSLARLGALDIEAGRTEEGLAALARSIELAPSDARAQLEFGLAAAASGALDRAARALDAACASSSVTDEERLEAARRFGADARVAPWLEPVVRRDPQRTEALWRLGQAHSVAGRRGRGLELLEQAAQSDPGDVDALVAYAAGLIGSGQLDAARAIVDHARALGLTSVEAERVDAVAAELEKASAPSSSEEPSDSDGSAGRTGDTGETGPDDG